MLLQGSTPTPLRAIAVQTPRHMESSSQDLELRPASAFTESQLRELESLIANAVTQAVTTVLRTQAVTTALRFQDPGPEPIDEPTYEAVPTAICSKDPAPTAVPTDKSASAPACQRVLFTDKGYYDPRLDGKGDIFICGIYAWFRDLGPSKGQDLVQGVG
ncbi:hypothetical protein HYFRA_00005022 [Hymenoscyphus fraxineus]|uniref:Uncharacterized protein n=1 Tax=Hymenoscyphus fraxineus TaxID=746836 RepID=A0A9N9KMG5_9HELO|nr:hypothetical protein HYFRA_00005022 [Hymenoscyphus fraxineus]